jgi:hypothetical protein
MSVGRRLTNSIAEACASLLAMNKSHLICLSAAVVLVHPTWARAIDAQQPSVAAARDSVEPTAVSAPIEN